MSIRYRPTTAVIAVTLALISVLPAYAGAEQTARQKTAALIKTLTGEWIGTCQQSTDGEDAENKYFQAKFEQTGENTFTGKFTYYRLDQKTNEPLNIGETALTATIQEDGTIRNEIVGKGSVIVNKDPKNQEHKVTEILTPTDDKTLSGKIDGKISVSGLPFGIGKNGQIRNATSTWKLENGVMTIDQTLKAGFKVLMVSKSFTVKACSVARRGTDVVSLMKKDLASKPAQPTPGS